MPSRTSKSAREFFIYIGISVTVTILVILLTEDVVFDFPPLRRAELSLIDLRFQRRGPLRRRADPSDVVIVEISQESYKSLPEKWPWPRTYYTRLVRNLNRAGARAIGIDLTFSTPDFRDPANDGEFRREISRAGDVILAGEAPMQGQYYTKVEHGENYGNLFIDSAARFGLVNVRSDVDGVLRRYTPFFTDSSGRIPTFCFAVLNAYFHQSPMTTVTLSGPAFGYLGRSLPKYNESSFLINYYGPSDAFPRINIADVLDDRDFATTEELRNPGEETNTFDDTTLVPAFDGQSMVPSGYLYNGTFSGKIVLVGSMVPEDKDLFPASIGQEQSEAGNQMYGVEIYANIVQSILDRNFITRQPHWMTVCIVFGLSLSTFVLMAGLKAIKTRYSALIEMLGAVIMISELFIIYEVSIRVFVKQNYLSDMMSPMMAVVFSYVASTIYNYVTERKQKFLIKGMFSQYVNPNVVDELVSHPEKLRLGGERKELTVFFSDIEEFTRISEQILPENLVSILNEYLSAMTAIIFSHSGTLDKYEGDAIVAFWGAPIPQPDHAVRACRTAVEMQDALRLMRVNWKNEGKPGFNVRIGINTGQVIVGNMGGIGRFDYTAIGDPVNLGSRLEGVNKQYRTNTIISEHTYRAVAGQVIARELDMLVVAGKTEPIRVYELLAMSDGPVSPKQMQFIGHYEKGLELYRKREWRLAVKQFECALELFPKDYPSELYIDRSHLYLASPPPDDWNGVFILRTK